MDTRRSTYEGRLTKSLAPIEIKADSVAEGVISSYDSKFWEVDSYAEFTVPGCADKTIAERGPKSETPRILGRYEHSWTVGRYNSMESDDIGIKSEMYISDDGQWGTALRAHLADGIPYGKSIGFRAVRRRPATEEDIPKLILDNAPAWVLQFIADGEIQYLTALEEIMLYESSVVSFPAVESIVVQDYRSDQSTPLLERALADLKSGRLGDDQIALIRQIAAALPVDGKPGAGETPATPLGDRAAEPRIRNRHAELASATLFAGVSL